MPLVSNNCVSQIGGHHEENHTRLATVVLLGTSLSGLPMISQAEWKQQTEPKSRQNLIREVRHQLVLLPYYSVFDNLAFRVEGDTVILEGQVVRPTLKSDAENVVKNIEGIGRVVNNIEGAAAIAHGRPDSPSGGALPRTLSFDNVAGFNDYFTGFAFGSTLSFLVNF